MIDRWILFLYYTLFIDQFYGQVSMVGRNSDKYYFVVPYIYAFCCSGLGQRAIL